METCLVCLFDYHCLHWRLVGVTLLTCEHLVRRLVDRKSTVAFDAYNRKLYDPDEIQDLQALAVGSRGAVFNELDDFVR